MTAQRLLQEPKRRDYLKSVGPGVVAGAADTDPTVALFWVATPIGLSLLVLVAGNPRLMSERPAGHKLLIAGWAVTALVGAVSVIYRAQQFHLLDG